MHFLFSDVIFVVVVVAVAAFVVVGSPSSVAGSQSSVADKLLIQPHQDCWRND